MNFPIKREQRKLAFFAEREENRAKPSWGRNRNESNNLNGQMVIMV